MTDTFAEQLVKKPVTSSDSLKKIFIIITAGIIMALLLLLCFVTAFAIVPIGLVAALVYAMITGMNVEYEYAVTNGSLDIDKIIAQRKRKNMITVDVKDFTEFDLYENADEFTGTTILAAGGDEELYYAEFKTDTYGEVRLVFSPNEKMLGCIRPYLPGSLKRK